MPVPSVTNSQISPPAFAANTRANRSALLGSKKADSGWHRKSGDVVELSGLMPGLPSEAGATAPGTGGATPAIADSVPLAESGRWKIIAQMQHELRQQWMASVGQALATAGCAGDSSAPDSAPASIPVIERQVEMTPESAAAADSQAPQTDAQNSLSGLDPYWNAENTSDRIVDFAMQFASAHGADPQAFVQTIVDAVKQGFQTASAVTGDVPGAAGQLTRDTFDATNKKLQSRLEAWRSTLYNQPVTAQPEASDAAS